MTPNTNTNHEVPSSSTSTTNKPAPPSSRLITHTWEETKSDAKWSSIHEDEHGNLISTIGGTAIQTPANIIRARRKRQSQLDYHAQRSNNKRILRDMIRYVYLVLDLSENMYEKDVSLGSAIAGVASSSSSKRTKLDIILQLAQDFITEYYDQNPLSHLGIIVCYNGEAQILSLLSGCKRSAYMAIGAIQEAISHGLFFTTASTSNNKGGAAVAGEFSLQNGLEVAISSLSHLPPHGSREIILLIGALSTCDPGDVLVDTLPRIISSSIRVNCLALCAEMHVCRTICEKSGGVLGVALDGRHLRDLFMKLNAPPPVLLKQQQHRMVCEFLSMGFPTQQTEDVPTLIHSVLTTGSNITSKDNALFLSRTGYVCPRCKTKVNELPADCAVCGLKLVLTPHLARSYHHLFPVTPFVELSEDVDLTSAQTIIEQNPDGHDQQQSSNIEKVATTVSSSLELGFMKVSTSSATTASTTQTTKKVDSTIDTSLLLSSTSCDRCCFACLKVIGVKPMTTPTTSHSNNKSKQSNNVTSQKSSSGGQPESLRFQCPNCHNVFCADCDVYLHETLHNCPGCLCK